MKQLFAALLIAFIGGSVAAADSFRIATFNASLSRKGPGVLVRDLEQMKQRQIKAVIEIIATVRPDILLINEFDHDRDGVALSIFTKALADAGIAYPHSFSAPSNTGEPSGIDLNNDGKIAGPNDAFGFGRFPGQYAMALLSRFPIAADKARSFRKLLWKDVPNAEMPTKAGSPFYPADVLSVFRLSSKSHWDVPVILPDGRTLHVLASHPTPPVFDGSEDANGLRNRDEILLWARYLVGQSLTDDMGQNGPFTGRYFAILGDLNADPFDGDGRHDGITTLLNHPRVQDPMPGSDGGVAATKMQAGSNATHKGDPALDTADWRDEGGPGNLRVDYVLPSQNLSVTGSGVFWPPKGAPGAKLIGSGKPVSSDHRLVWVDIALE